MITQAFDLNMIPNSAPVVVHVDQYDHGDGRLIISLYKDTVAYTPSGTAKIQGRKPDGHGFEYACTISGNVVTADLTEQMTAVSGQVRCQIVVTESGDRTGTFAFILEVQPSALPDDSEMSDSDYQLVEQMLEAASDSEAWAVGERDGVPVDPTDETYHNNSKWWAEQSGGGGATSLASLTDVNLSTPTDGESLVYDGTTNKWVNGDGGSGATTFAALTDVDVTGATNGQVPAYNSSTQKWENESLSIPDEITDLTDVSITSAQNGQGLIYDSASSKWKNQNIPSGGATDLDDLSDVTLTSPTSGQVLKYDGSGWVNANESGGGGSSTLAGLTDVTIASATDGQVLEYDSTSSKWENKSLTIPDDLNDMTDVALSSPTGGQGLVYDGTASKWKNQNIVDDLADLSDVTLATPTNGQVLKYNSSTSKWENANESGGGSGDYVGLYGTTEITSGTDLNDLLTVGTYYKNATNFTPTNAPLPSTNQARFIMDVRQIYYPSGTPVYYVPVMQTVTYIRESSTGVTIYDRAIYDDGNNNHVYTAWVLRPKFLSNLKDVSVENATGGEALWYDGGTGYWRAKKGLPIKTAAQSCVIGDTTVTFTDANILTTSEIWPYAETSSGTPVTFTSCVVSVDGTAVLTFPALTEAASIYLKITNY